MTTNFFLEKEHIELYKLLKVEGIASTGGEAKTMIAAGAVKLNGQVELRKRNKLRVGDVVEFEGSIISITGVEDAA